MTSWVTATTTRQTPLERSCNNEIMNESSLLVWHSLAGSEETHYEESDHYRHS